MILGGLIPNSLIDFPGKPAVVAFTQGCNWRCPYCHNADLIPRKRSADVAVADVFRLLERRPAGARNLVVTGGEPTLQPGLIRFLQEAACLGARVKLDTNGSNPALLQQILNAGLADYVAMDVKGPLECYERYCGRSASAETIEQSIHFVLQSGVDHEFRTTVVPALHTLADFERIGAKLGGGKRLYLQTFRPGKALRRTIARTPAPTTNFLNACAEVTQHWLPTYVRN